MKWIFLSHYLRPGLPAYDGQQDVCRLKINKSLAKGDSANTLQFSLNNHAGTHFDFPRHVLPGGKTLDDYPAAHFVFSRPALIHLPLETGRYINDEDLGTFTHDEQADIVLIKTGYSDFYGTDKYWNDNPGLDRSAAEFLKKHYPASRCVGVDFISLNAHKDKEPGRLAHQTLLSQPEMLILEDLDLSKIAAPPLSIAALPLPLAGADGAPATVIAALGD